MVFSYKKAMVNMKTNRKPKKTLYKQQKWI
jgi:hypothetical protein